MKNNLNKHHDGSFSKSGDSKDPKSGSSKRIYVYAFICLIVKTLLINYFTTPEHWQTAAVLTVACLIIYVFHLIGKPKL